MGNPHREAVLYLGKRQLVVRQGTDFLVVNEQPVGVLNLEVVGIRGFELDDSTVM